MQATGWKGSNTYGVRVGPANAARYFNQSWKSVELEIDGKFHNYKLLDTFWVDRPEFRGGVLKTWLLRHRLAPWPPFKTPKLVLTPLGGNRFRLSLPQIVQRRFQTLPGPTQRHSSIESSWPMIKLEIQTIGDSAGVVLPDDVLSRLNLKVGDTVFLTETKDGYQLRRCRSEFERQMEIAERVMSEHYQTLKKLADS